jgi:spore germination protein KC
MDKWNDIFSRLPVDVWVDIKIRQTGLIKSPMKKDE